MSVLTGGVRTASWLERCPRKDEGAVVKRCSLVACVLHKARVLVPVLSKSPHACVQARNSGSTDWVCNCMVIDLSRLVSLYEPYSSQIILFPNLVNKAESLMTTVVCVFVPPFVVLLVTLTLNCSSLYRITCYIIYKCCMNQLLHIYLGCL